MYKQVRGLGAGEAHSLQVYKVQLYSNYSVTVFSLWHLAHFSLLPKSTTHTPSSTHTHSHTYTLTHHPPRTHTILYTHTRLHTILHTHTHTHTHIHVHTPPRTHMHIQSSTHIHAYTPSSTHTHTHTHSHTILHTHTHTHTQVVRKQTLNLLACLLQEDYVKWRGSLFFRFVSSLIDPELKRFGEFCMVHLLLARHPTMFYQHLVECVFHFNGYEKHKGKEVYQSTTVFYGF